MCIPHIMELHLSFTFQFTDTLEITWLLGFRVIFATCVMCASPQVVCVRMSLYSYTTHVFVCESCTCEYIEEEEREDAALSCSWPVIWVWPLQLTRPEPPPLQHTHVCMYCARTEGARVGLWMWITCACPPSAWSDYSAEESNPFLMCALVAELQWTILLRFVLLQFIVSVFVCTSSTPLHHNFHTVFSAQCLVF